MNDIVEIKEIKLSDLKRKSPAEMLVLAEELQIEAASTLRKQELMFAILKTYAGQNIEIIGQGVIEVLQDGFGFLRSGINAINNRSVDHRSSLHPKKVLDG